jgi:hypothetical protein
MEEIQVHRNQEAVGGGPNPADDNDSLMATVSHWPYCERLPVANMSVGEIRRRYSERFDIDPRSQATVDGNEAGVETIVRPGQMLMFVRRAGEKGR